MATHSSTLAWKIPWMEEPGRLQSMGPLGVGHDWATSLSLFTFHFHALEKEMATRSSVLAWRILGAGEPGGLLSMGSHRVGHDWSDLAAAAVAVYLFMLFHLLVTLFFTVSVCFVLFCYCCIVKVTQSSLTLHDPMDFVTGSSVHGILQVRLLEWVAVPFSRGIFSTQGLNPRVLLIILLFWKV